jgi:hypothetical protein
VDWQRVPYISFALHATALKPHPSKPGEYLYEGDLIRTGRMTSHPGLLDGAASGGAHG